MKHTEKIYQLAKAEYNVGAAQDIRDIFSMLYRKIILAVEQHYGEKAERQEKKDYAMKLFVKDIMGFEKGTDQTYTVLLEHLGWLDIRNAYVYVFEQPMLHLYQEETQLPDKLYLKAVLKNGSVKNILGVNQQVALKDIFSNRHIEEDGRAKVLLPLFSNEMQYGVLLCDMTERLFENGDFVVNQMGSAIKMIELLKANDRIQRQLEESLVTLKENNIALDTLSKSDGLTGILNRRGFFEKAEKMFRFHKENGCNSVVAYIDVNNLKILNDRYGHEEGDFAIRKTSELLTEAVGKDGVVGRIGGDEFALLMSCGTSLENNIKEKIYYRFRTYNAKSPKPYNVTVSVGSHILKADSPEGIQEALNFADEMLYEEKKFRTKNVAK